MRVVYAKCMNVAYPIMHLKCILTGDQYTGIFTFKFVELVTLVDDGISVFAANQGELLVMGKISTELRGFLGDPVKWRVFEHRVLSFLLLIQDETKKLT